MKQHENVRDDEQTSGDENEIKVFYCICYAIYGHIQFN